MRKIFGKFLAAGLCLAMALSSVTVGQCRSEISGIGSRFNSFPEEEGIRTSESG